MKPLQTAEVFFYAELDSVSQPKINNYNKKNESNSKKYDDVLYDDAHNVLY